MGRKSERSSIDIGSLLCGWVVIALGTLLLLDSLDVLHMRWGWMGPALLAGAGGVLLAVGLFPRSGGGPSRR
jgi:hypothetical protein